MQLFQFTAIFAQSLLSYRIGPTCGSPDFAKLLMIVYMGSMVALFSNFFLQRYILQRPYTSLDLCGVIKRPLPPTPPPAPLCGTVRLTPQGTAVVTLPPSFRPRVGGISLSEEDSLPFAFLLTPIGAPMPNLHVAKPLYRVAVSNLGNDSDSGSGSGSGSSPGGGASSSTVSVSVSGREKTGSGRERERERETMSGVQSSGQPVAQRGKSVNKANSSGSGLHRSYSSLGNLAAANGSFNSKHNDRLIDGPLPSLPSILSTDKGLCTLSDGTHSGVADTHTDTIQSSEGGGRGSQRRSSLKANKRAAGPVRYCFSIAGGRSGGKVSWYINSASDELTGEEGWRMRHSSEDWRTIS